MSYKTSAPGSLMLLGEYAVLFGKPALVCAVDKRIHVTLSPRTDTRVHIHSPTLGQYETELFDIQLTKPFQFVLAAVKHYQSRLRYGCDLHIESEFSDKVGLGSSAAVTVATLAALASWLDIRMQPIDLVRKARGVIRECQGLGSGADVAASVFGGVVYYTAQPLSAEKIAIKLPLSLHYTGFKTPTVEAVKAVDARFQPYPQLFRQLCNAIGQCTEEGLRLIRKNDWNQLGSVMNIQQGLMAALGVTMPVIDHMVEILRQQSGVKGAKISGSGLGDCVIGLGESASDIQFGTKYADIQPIPVEMTLHGVQGEKI